MSKREEYETRTQQLLIPIAREQGVEIYDVEYVRERGGWYLRAYLEKPGGVGIQDCEAVSRALSAALDEEDFIPDSYVLEVSSPGLGRTLKKDGHLAGSLGQEVEVRLFGPLEDPGAPVSRKLFQGVLHSFDAERLTILEGGVPRTFRRKEIALIRLTLDF
jgi:ribosome maturation factor RimP